MNASTRSTRVRAAALALALAGMGVAAGTGTAAAATAPDCVLVPNAQASGNTACIGIDPAKDGGLPLGYGSLGTASVSDLLSRAVQTGSALASLGLPQATGILLPGSTGSYGPEASVGQLSATSTGSLLQGSIGH